MRRGNAKLWTETKEQNEHRSSPSGEPRGLLLITFDVSPWRLLSLICRLKNLFTKSLSPLAPLSNRGEIETQSYPAVSLPAPSNTLRPPRPPARQLSGYGIAP